MPRHELDLDSMVGTVHRAGPFIDGVQRCLDCNGIMCDYRGSMTPEGQSLPNGYEENADVTYWGSLIDSNSSAVGVHHPAIHCKTVPS
jgi:hypothetical protein